MMFRMENNTQHEMEHQTFNGINFLKDNRSGYFWSTSKKTGNVSMHRYVWNYYNGEIPEGYEIHHIDGDPSNNDIKNLKCSKRCEHRREHQEHKMGLVSNGHCVECGAELKDKCGVFCSSRCKQAYARHNGYYKIEKTCAYCGKKFLTNKYRKSETCSHLCSNLIRQKRISEGEPTHVCVVCGKKYFPQPNNKHNTCSMKCTKKLWEQNNPEKVAEQRKRRLKGKTYVNKTCEICGKVFMTSRSIKMYCSDECAKVALYKKIHKYDKVCPICGKHFMAINPKQVYCSRKCTMIERWKNRKSAT